MPLVKIAQTAEVEPGSAIEVHSGERAFALCNVGGTVYCLDNVCPHAGGPLAQGGLNGSTLVCPWHGWEFDCLTGQNLEDEDLTVDRYVVVIQDDSVFIDIPAE